MKYNQIEAFILKKNKRKQNKQTKRLLKFINISLCCSVMALYFF